MKLVTFAALLWGIATLVPFAASARAQATQPFDLECDSSSGGYVACAANASIEHVDLTQQLSTAACVYGQSWGYDRTTIWVNFGCRAIFLVTPVPQPAYQDVGCGSHNYQYKACDVGFDIEHVDLLQQTSNAGCEEGRSWGYGQRYVWVDRGCGGVFRVYGY
jgi:hypothetical protein